MTFGELRVTSTSGLVLQVYCSSDGVILSNDFLIKSFPEKRQSVWILDLRAIISDREALFVSQYLSLVGFKQNSLLHLSAKTYRGALESVNKET